MFTIRNAVLVALMQIGVIVAGVLAAAVDNKWWTSMGALALPPPTSILMNYGVAALAMPAVWIIIVLLLRGRPNVSDDVKAFAFFSGTILLLTLGVFVGYAVLTPWFHVEWGMAHEN